MPGRADFFPRFDPHPPPAREPSRAAGRRGGAPLCFRGHAPDFSLCPQRLRTPLHRAAARRSRTNVPVPPAQATVLERASHEVRTAGLYGARAGHFRFLLAFCPRGAARRGRRHPRLRTSPGCAPRHRHGTHRPPHPRCASCAHPTCRCRRKPHRFQSDAPPHATDLSLPGGARPRVNVSGCRPSALPPASPARLPRPGWPQRGYRVCVFSSAATRPRLPAPPRQGSPAGCPNHNGAFSPADASALPVLWVHCEPVAARRWPLSSRAAMSNCTM